MIKGLHAMFYTSDAEGLRAFLRDKLGLRWADVGEGWLIFEAPQAEIGCHPAAATDKQCPPGTHSISFYCDDIQKTVAELKARGVEFLSEVKDAGFGHITHFRMPGGVQAELYQAKYTLKYTH
jgi:catechol 2,3-dioxygenase-like lactoylglutathione lyase family enzyme